MAKQAGFHDIFKGGFPRHLPGPDTITETTKEAFEEWEKYKVGWDLPET